MSFSHVLPTLVTKTPTMTTFSDVDLGNFFAQVGKDKSGKVDPNKYQWNYLIGSGKDRLYIDLARRFNANSQTTNISWVLSTVIRETDAEGLITDHPFVVTVAVNHSGEHFPDLATAKVIIEAALGILVAGSLASGTTGDNESTLFDKVDHDALAYTCF